MIDPPPKAEFLVDPTRAFLSSKEEIYKSMHEKKKKKPIIVKTT